jgi:hypothetical protein
LAINSHETEEGWGYTTKVNLAKHMDEQICSSLGLDIAYFAYFTEEFNASGNPSTSNPLEIYKALDEAVKYGAIRHAKVESIRSALARAVIIHITPVNVSLKDDLIEQISKAGLEEFSPQVWRFPINSLPQDGYEPLNGEFRTKGYSLPQLVVQVAIP